MPYTDPRIIAGDVVTQKQVESSTYIRKEREERRKLYEQLPHEDLKEFPFTKMLMTKKGNPVKNYKTEWFLQTLPIEHGQSTITSVNAGSGTITLNASSGLLSQIKPRTNEVFTLVKVSSGAVTHRIPVEYVSAGSGTYTFRVIKGEDDNGTVAGFYPAGGWSSGLATSDTVYISPAYTVFPEGSGLPPGRFQTPIGFYNYSQIVMEAFAITGSELADLDIFDESKYNRYVKQTFRRFNNQIENIIRYGVRRMDSANTYDGDEGQRTWCGGLEYFMKQYMSNNIINIPTLGDSEDLKFNFTGMTWQEGCYDFIKCLLTYIGKTSVRRKTLIGSVDVIKNINDVLETMTNVNVETRVKNDWGFEVTRIHSTLCELDLLIDYHSTINPGFNSIVWIITPDMFEYRPRINRDITIITSLKDLPSKVENGFTWRDATKEGMFVDFTIEYNYLDGCAIIYNWGRDFAAS